MRAGWYISFLVAIDSTGSCQRANTVFDHTARENMLACKVNLLMGLIFFLI